MAALLGISVRAVRQTERRAFEKLRRHPALRRFWREYAGLEKAGQSVEETGEEVLSDVELAALMALARAPTERRALVKLLDLIGVGAMHVILLVFSAVQGV